jgi:hypothetical protein
MQFVPIQTVSPRKECWCGIASASTASGAWLAEFGVVLAQRRQKPLGRHRVGLPPAANLNDVLKQALAQ